MSSDSRNTDSQTNLLFKTRYQNECQRINRFMVWLMVAQWFAGIAFALFFTPFTWIGESYELHVHVKAAVLLGGSISLFAILWARKYPNSAHTRHVFAICQMLWSALLIHLSGGRIETHFHVFASLAILSIYRDWKILITATVVVAADHAIRGIFYPLSAFGIATESPYRWMEHAAWVLFEVAFLAPGCMRLRNEIRELCVQQTKIVAAKQSVDIKVRERTEELVSANQLLAEKTHEAEKLALVARYTENAVVITDGQSRIEWVNEGFTRITGYELNEVVGKRPAEFQHGPQTDPKSIELMRLAIKNKCGFDTEVVNYRKSGEPYWLAIEARPIPDENGEVTRFIAIQSDISERKSMQMSLAAAEQRLRSLVDNVPGVFFRRGIEDTLPMQFISKSVHEVTGYQPEEFVDHKTISLNNIIWHEDFEKVNAEINLAIEQRRSYEIEYRIVDRSGNTKRVWERGQCLEDSDGNAILDGMIFDITERKLAEAELVYKGKLIEESLNEIFIFDSATFHFLYVNRVGRENIGYSLDELEQLSPLDIKPEFDMDSFKRLVQPLDSGEQQQIVFQTIHQRKDGSTYNAEIRLQRSTFQDQQVYLAMILDVTKRVEAADKNAQLQKDLIDASRKAGMTEVATGVLHNVGNILNSVNVSATVIRRCMENSALFNLKRVTGLIAEYEDSFADFVREDHRGKKLPAYIQKVTEALSNERTQIDKEFYDLVTNVEHIKEIVTVQQSMAKSSGIKQELSARELVSDVLTATKSSLTSHQIKVIQNIDDCDSRLISDKHKILQILINLIGNAKDALVEHQVKDPTIQIEVLRQDAEIVFRVIDNGIGIPKEKLAKIFQHGFTTKDTGHGFGLHCSANAATELGGSLNADSAGIGHGASFELRLPNSTKDQESNSLQPTNA